MKIPSSRVCLEIQDTPSLPYSLEFLGWVLLSFFFKYTFPSETRATLSGNRGSFEGQFFFSSLVFGGSVLVGREVYSRALTL